MEKKKKKRQLNEEYPETQFQPRSATATNALRSLVDNLVPDLDPTINTATEESEASIKELCGTCGPIRSSEVPSLCLKYIYFTHFN